MNPAQALMPDWLQPFAFLPLFALLWCGVIALVSLVGGWHHLAKRYRREETTFRIAAGDIGENGPTEKFGWSSLTMGPSYFPTNYGNCVTVSVGDDGIGLKVMFFIRILHPPLLIPWSAIESCQLDKEFLIFDCATIRLDGEPRPLRIYGRAGRAIDRYWTATRSEDKRRERHT